jgi:hypothetical protein
MPEARRFLDGLDGPDRDLPLFRGRVAPISEEEVTVEIVRETTLRFWTRLLRRAAARRGVRPEELNEEGRLLAVALPDGPALLAARGTGGWRAVLAPRGDVARRIQARIPTGDDVGRAA